MNVPTDRRPLALLAAGLLVVGVTVAVILFGIAQPPPLEPLATSDVEVPGELAFVGFGAEPCIHVVATDGAVRELRCGPPDGQLVVWDERGIVIADWGRMTPELVVIDPDTGDVLERGQREDPGTSELERVDARRVDGRLEVRRSDTGALIWRVDSVEGYQIIDGVIDPDGEVVAMLDSFDRLLVVPVDGSADPVVWAEGTDASGGFVWEGTPPQR